MRVFFRPPAFLVLVPLLGSFVSGTLAALIPGSMATPYVDETDMASINEAYSVDSCAPWGFEHRGIDFFPTGDLKPFRAVADGTIESIGLHHNYLPPSVDFWQVNLKLTIDATYWAHYAFEPMSDEADAILQLSHIVVGEGQSVAEGDIIGYLLDAAPGAHVDFSLYEVWDPICPAPFFTPTAQSSILNVLWVAWPWAQLCYGPEQAIPAASIFVDGDPLDWSGVWPAAADRENDEELGPTAYDGDDLEALYVARSVDDLFLRLDLWEDANPGFENGPPPTEGRYSVELDTDSATHPELYLSVAYDVDNSWWALGHNGSNAPGSPGSLEEREDLVAVNGGMMEIKLPLASIGNPTRIDRVRAEVVDCCVASPPTPPGLLDETHCVGNLIFTTPLESLQGLDQYVGSLDLDNGAATSLHSKLDAARDSLEGDRPRPAINQLGAFVEYAEAQSGKKIPMAAANQMILRAERVIALIQEG